MNLNRSASESLFRPSAGRETRAARSPCIERFERISTLASCLAPSHEPVPLTPSLSPTGGEGVRRTGEGDVQVARIHGTRALVALLLTSLLLGFAPLSRAQVPLSDLIFTVGTTIEDGTNQRSYVLLNSPDSHLLAGKRFAVYGKAGYPESPNAFTLRGTLAQQNDPVAIDLLLNQSVGLRQDLPALDAALTMLLHSVPGITNLSLPQKVAIAFQIAVAEPDIAEILLLMGQMHPGLNLCAGRAFSEPISAVTTYELRELHPVNGEPGDVIGRVTVVPGAPVVLPAPGRPFQVTTNDPSDHLLVRLRWGMPLELRRLSLLNYGFNLWRIPRDAAEAANFHLTPPTVSQLRSNPNFSRANAAPAMATMEYGMGSGPGHADDPNDRITHFFADNGRATGTTFADGQEFYYFVTARDLLGRDGLVSQGGLARACRRLPPQAPTDVRVENAVLPGSTNQARLQVIWEQNNNVTNAVTHYWIYRWTNPTDALTNDDAPLAGRIGIVDQIPDSNLNLFLDDTPGAFTEAGVSNVWYTVRAVSEASCDPLLSPHAGPASGVLRQRDGPEATTGEVIGSCGLPVVMFQEFATNLTATATQRWSFTLTAVRRDPGIEWAQFTVTDWDSWSPPRTNVTTFGPIYFPPDGDTLQLEYMVDDDLLTHTQRVACVVGTMDDLISAPATVLMPSATATSPPREVVFYAGQLLTTALSGSDPLLAALNGGFTHCIEPYSVAADASGMVAMQFDFNGSPTALIQALLDNAWVDVATVTPDADRVYWVSYPACLIGPMPPFRACIVNLPNQGADCDQHVVSAAPEGAIAPLRVRFKLTPRTQEYRVYRRVDDGPLTLVAQGAAAYELGRPNKVIETVDDAMPPSAARLCYFVQLLDEHGNGGPLSYLRCVYTRPPNQPRPVLAEPQPAGDLANPQVALNWFCPTAGVARFQFKLRRVNSPDPAVPGLLSSQLTRQIAYNPSKVYAGLLIQGPKLFRFQEAHFTAPIGPDFGPGPQFTLMAGVEPNVEYEISVAPVDERGKVADGSTSEVWRFTWTPPIVLANVPWPARPLPPARSFDDVPAPGVGNAYRVRAVLMRSSNRSLDYRYPVGVTIGDFSRMAGITGDFNHYFMNVGTTNFLAYRFFITPSQDPNQLFVFRRHSNDPARHGESLLPIVLYRQQVANEMYPRVSGNVIQVTPLIERIPWIFNRDATHVTVPDRLIGNAFVSVNNTNVHFICLRDPQPVLQGATYRYFIARFNAKRELEEIIPAGEVQIPVDD
jgi:hypothetical protein